MNIKFKYDILETLSIKFNVHFKCRTILKCESKSV